MKIVKILILTISLGTISCHQSSEINYSTNSISSPELFAKGVISTETNSEFELTFSPDGQTVYFSRRKPEEKQKIYVSHFENHKWSEPQVAAFSIDRDETASITPDGKYFFFGSERPIAGRPNKGNFDMNIWMMKNINGQWSEPEPLPEPLNEVQQEGEEWPSSNNNFLFTNDNKTFYFTTMKRGTNSIKLYKTLFDGEQFLEPKVISGLFEDDKYWIYSAVISREGKYLLFNSYGNPSGEGGEDIYVAKKTESGWSKAKSIGKMVNTENEESNPRFSIDGKYFFFSRAENLGDYEYGEWNIFYVESEYLGLEDLFK